MRGNVELDESYERNRAYNSRFRAVAEGVSVDFTPDDWIEMLKEHGYVCYYCEYQPYNNREIVIEHFIPLKKGGSHDKYNIVPSCHQCNARKKNLMPKEFLQQLRRSSNTGEGRRIIESIIVAVETLLLKQKERDATEKSARFYGQARLRPSAGDQSHSIRLKSGILAEITRTDGVWRVSYSNKTTGSLIARIGG